MRLQEVDEDVNSTEVGHPPGRIIASYVTLLDGATCALLGTFDIVGADVFLSGHETKPLEMADLLVEMGSKRRDQRFQGPGQVHRVGVDLHVDIVVAEKGFVPFAQVEIVRIEVSAHFVDVSEGGTRARRCGENATLGVGSLVEVANLSIGVVSCGVVGFIQNEQVHLSQIDDPVHGVVADDLRCGHDHRGLIPQRFSLLWSGLARVGYDAFLIETQAFNGHGALLVDQAGGWGDEDNFVASLSQKLRHGHPFHCSFAKSSWHHHEAGKRENTLKRTQLVASGFNTIAQQRMDNLRHEIHFLTRVQKDDVGGVSQS